MKSIIAFWKKDIINKLIVVISMGIVIGFLSILYFFLNMPKDSIFYATFLPANKGVPTLAPAAATETGIATPTTVFFPSMTPFDVAPVTAVPTFPVLAVPTQTAVVFATPTSTPSLVPTTISALASCIPNTTPQSGRVVDVIDGNTLKVYTQGKIYMVRYIGIAVPKYGEFKEPFGQAAQMANSKLVFGKDVTLIKDASDKDSVGHLIRYVIVNGIFVNLELVQQGWATSLEVPPDTSCAQTFKSAEQTARQALIGRWAPTPTPSH